jgi:hypothetical protein
MNTSPFRTIILPALLISGAVFTALTLPVASTRASDMAGQWSVPMQRWLALSASSQQRGLSIRYIGFAILSSTAIGIGTAEVLRSHQSNAQKRLSLLQQVLQEGNPNEPLTEPAIPGDLIEPELGTLPEAVAPEATPAPELTPSEVQVAPLDWEALQAGTIPSPEVSASAVTRDNPVLTHAYPTCQIQTPLGQRLTAIQVDGEFYSVYGLRKTLPKAHHMIERLQHAGQIALATPDEAGYVIWLYQPGAEAATLAEPSPVPLQNWVAL